MTVKTIVKFTIFLFSGFSNLICLAGYFQQEVSYKINVTLDDQKHSLFGDETIVYKNNSPEDLNIIYMHIWTAAYSNTNTMLAKEFYSNGDNRFLSASEKDFGNIHSLDFSINGEKVQWKKLKDTTDICVLKLLKPLKPGDSITISTPFRVKIPADYISRMGHNGQSYFITQWFPKPAVYDSSGWNYFPYQDQGEFYGEFGTFDVYITLPENYVLAATGVRIDAEAEIKWLNKKDSITRNSSVFFTNGDQPVSSPTTKTIHFRQDMIHDFAWFADKSWNVLKDTFEIADTGKTITTWSFFSNREAAFWMNAPKYLRDGIEFYSSTVGNYPYDEISAVDVGNSAGNGMEYPMIMTIGNYGSDIDLEQTILHEVGHNWFYGILGNNERRYPVIDEGLNTFLETRYVFSKYKNDSLRQTDTSPFPFYFLLLLNDRINHRMRSQYRYLGQARQNLDESPDQSSEKFSPENYRSDVYSKSTISFDYLFYYLGDSLFDACIKDYYEKWKFRHPQPENLRESFELISTKNLSWIFSDLLKSSKKLNYKICSVNNTDSGFVKIKFKNNGDINGPFPVQAMKQGKLIQEFWIEGFTGILDTVIRCIECDVIYIDSGKRLPELYHTDNRSRTKGLFRLIEKPDLKAGFRLEDGSKTQIFYLPALGWNNYNKLLAGVVFHNFSLHEKKFEYALMPLFATSTKDLAGGGNISYHFYPKHSRISRITFSSGISRYAFFHDSYSNNDFDYSHVNHFTKSDSRITFSLRQKNNRENYRNTATIRSIYLVKENPYGLHYRPTKTNKLFVQLEYARKGNNPLKRSLEKISVTVNDEFLGVQGEVKKFFVYNSPEKGFQTRFFSGYIKSTTPEFDYRMSLSGKTGERDFLFDDVFLGRTENEGLLSQQFVNDYSGFKTPTSYYRLAEKWMFGFNASTTLPELIPFRLFASVGSFDNADNNGQYGKISWEIGVDLPVIKDIFVVSFPFAYSNDIKYAIEDQKLKKSNLIRFELRLNELNPLKLIKSYYEK
jgi:hypothetical protein